MPIVNAILVAVSPFDLDGIIAHRLEIDQLGGIDI